ncbi:MAG: carboxylate-amine ligase [Desulfomonilia bacterium]
MSSQDQALHLFEGYGIELEYMIVDRKSMDILPVADKVLHAVASSYDNEVEMGRLAWSNELVLHVIELKTNGPARILDDLPHLFRDDLEKINEILFSMGGMLMPTAMHPWMNPERETRLWPHENNEIYQSYNRIFLCTGHGWSNVQSTHINLPFSGDEEFSRLHSAIRVVLPIIPAIAASSPIVDMVFHGILDYRMEAYRHNQERIGSIAGRIIPEAVTSREEYERRILAPMYRDIAPYDPSGILQYEWLNSRGAIARFDRSAIEIRVVDIQECPLADIAIVHLITKVIRALTEERLADSADQQCMETDELADIFLDTIRDGEKAKIRNRAYLDLFGVPPDVRSFSALDLWAHLFERCGNTNPEWVVPITHILTDGSLSTRILSRLGDGFSPESLKEVYRELCLCATENRLF